MHVGRLAGLALRDISGSPFRSWIVAACAFVIAAFLLATVLVVTGAQDSLQLAGQRLGADIMVMPQGSEEDIEGALLMGLPVKAWMPADEVAAIAAVPGVEAASPQLYLSSLKDAPCCSVSNMFMIAYEPSTDFTLQPWLKEELGDDLGLGQAVGGQFVFVPVGDENIELYGYILSLRGNLEPTGTNLDQTMFITFETAYDMARMSGERAVEPLVIPKGQVSAVLVKVAPGEDPEKVAAAISSAVPGVTAALSPEMFGEFRTQISGVLRITLIILGLTLILAVALLAFVFSIAAHERHRQIGVLRALGATRAAILVKLLTEAGILALAGALVGVVLAAVSVYLFRAALVDSLGFPFLYPDSGSLAALIVAGLAAALVVVALAALFPALHACRRDPASSMRE